MRRKWFSIEGRNENPNDNRRNRIVTAIVTYQFAMKTIDIKDNHKVCTDGKTAMFMKMIMRIVVDSDNINDDIRPHSNGNNCSNNGIIILNNNYH